MKIIRSICFFLLIIYAVCVISLCEAMGVTLEAENERW